LSLLPLRLQQLLRALQLLYLLLLHCCSGAVGAHAAIIIPTTATDARSTCRNAKPRTCSRGYRVPAGSGLLLLLLLLLLL